MWGIYYYSWKKRSSLKGRPPIDLITIGDMCIRERQLKNYNYQFKVDYIYAIKCPITNTVVYVGRSCGWEYRKKCHFNPNGKTLVNRWYKAMCSIGHPPIFEVIDATYGDISILEQHYILYYRSIGQALFNLKNKMHHIQGLINYNNRYFNTETISLTP